MLRSKMDSLASLRRRSTAPLASCAILPLSFQYSTQRGMRLPHHRPLYRSSPRERKGKSYLHGRKNSESPSDGLILFRLSVPSRSNYKYDFGAKIGRAKAFGLLSYRLVSSARRCFALRTRPRNNAKFLG